VRYTWREIRVRNLRLQRVDYVGTYLIQNQLMKHEANLRVPMQEETVEPRFQNDVAQKGQPLIVHEQLAKVVDKNEGPYQNDVVLCVEQDLQSREEVLVVEVWREE
jgi:hypothetical protein